MATTENKGVEIVLLYLQKLEKMTTEERQVLIRAIKMTTDPIMTINLEDVVVRKK